MQPIGHEGRERAPVTHLRFRMIRETSGALHLYLYLSNPCPLPPAAEEAYCKPVAGSP